MGSGEGPSCCRREAAESQSPAWEGSQEWAGGQGGCGQEPREQVPAGSGARASGFLGFLLPGPRCEADPTCEGWRAACAADARQLRSRHGHPILPGSVGTQPLSCLPALGRVKGRQLGQ